MPATHLGSSGMGWNEGEDRENCSWMVLIEKNDKFKGRRTLWTGHRNGRRKLGLQK